MPLYVLGDGERQQLGRQQAVSHDDSGLRHNGDSASDAAVLTSNNSSQQPPSAADSLPAHHQPLATTDLLGAVSLDDAWKTLSTSAVPSNGKRQRQLSEMNCFTGV